KWHLSGMEGGYYEMGRADGGFLDEYWYDGRRFINDVGKSGFEKWRKGRDLQDADCWGTRVADRGVAFIERFHNQPFFLAVSFDEPHGPSSAPERYYAMYRGTQRERAPNLSDMLENKPFIHQQLEKYYHGTGRVPAGALPNNDPRYYGCNTFVDGQIGRVLDAVDRHCPENTIVVYTTDHGAHQGAHGLLAKGPTMYEETTHVPFIVCAPGLTRPGSISNALVSHIDIAPTISELAGVPTHPQFQGQSLVPVLRNPTTGVQDAVFMEYARFGLEHDNHFGFVPIRCIRTERHKLVLNQTDMDELYDLQTDPWEMENRIDDPALSELRITLHDRLLDWMNRRIDPLRGEMWHSRRWRPDHHIDPWAGEHKLKEN
ncbi:MAG: sulfatase-like hydrolase/transferase, partial [Planctomycetota bacterium]